MCVEEAFARLSPLVGFLSPASWTTPVLSISVLSTKIVQTNVNSDAPSDKPNKRDASSGVGTSPAATAEPTWVAIPSQDYPVTTYHELISISTAPTLWGTNFMALE